MDGKELRFAFTSRSRVYGTALLSPSPFWPPTVAGLGLDFVFIDTEHIPLERDTVAWMCRTYRALGLAPVVRIPAPDPYQATMALDGGAEGILAPYIESAEQVRRLRGAVKFRPLKGRRLERALEDPGHLEPELAGYLDGRNANCSLLINIESVPAIESLDDILSEGGIEAVIVGPHDLSTNLGVPEQYTHPRFEEAIRTIISRCAARGVSAGIHAFWNNIPQEIEWARLGANVILHSADLLLFRRAILEDLHQIKSALGDRAAANASLTPV